LLLYSSYLPLGLPNWVVILPASTTCTWVGSLSAHDHWCLGWSARGPWVLHREGWISGFDPLGRVGVGMRCAEKDDKWLGSLTGPTPRNYGRGSWLSCATRLWSLLDWRTSTECKRMWHVTPCSEKELWTLLERCSQGTSNLCWLSGIVFRIKATSWRNVYKNLHCQTTLGSKAIVSASNTLLPIWTC
jgi:hypothetical protein